MRVFFFYFLFMYIYTNITYFYTRFRNPKKYEPKKKKKNPCIWIGKNQRLLIETKYDNMKTGMAKTKKNRSVSLIFYVRNTRSNCMEKKKDNLRADSCIYFLRKYFEYKIWICYTNRCLENPRDTVSSYDKTYLWKNLNPFIQFNL